MVDTAAVPILLHLLGEVQRQLCDMCLTAKKSRAFEVSATAILDQHEDLLISRLVAARVSPERADTALKHFADHARSLLGLALKHNQLAVYAALQDLQNAVLLRAQGIIDSEYLRLESDTSAAETALADMPRGAAATVDPQKLFGDLFASADAKSVKHVVRAAVLNAFELCKEMSGVSFLDRDTPPSNAPQIDNQRESPLNVIDAVVRDVTVYTERLNERINVRLSALLVATLTARCESVATTPATADVIGNLRAAVAELEADNKSLRKVITDAAADPTPRELAAVIVTVKERLALSQADVIAAQRETEQVKLALASKEGEVEVLRKELLELCKAELDYGLR